MQVTLSISGLHTYDASANLPLLKEKPRWTGKQSHILFQDVHFAQEFDHESHGTDARSPRKLHLADCQPRDKLRQPPPRTCCRDLDFRASIIRKKQFPTMSRSAIVLVVVIRGVGFDRSVFHTKYGNCACLLEKD